MSSNPILHFTLKKIIVFSPLEQFNLTVVNSYYVTLLPEIFGLLQPLNIVWLTLDNFILFSIVIGLLISGLTFVLVYHIKLIPTPLQYIAEFIYTFLYNTLLQQAGRSTIFFLPMAMSIFFFILSSNLLGLANWSYTVTAHLILTFFLAFSLNLALLFYGLVKKRFEFFKMFNPAGVPVFLRPLTIAIEVFSYILRNFSLPIRLFANMLAGHILLAIIASSFVAIASYVHQVEISAMFFIIDSCVIFAIIALELAVACIQAYVFTVLIIIYLRDSFGTSH